MGDPFEVAEVGLPTAGQIDGVRAGGARRQLLLERRDRGRAELGHLQAGLRDKRSGDPAVPAAVAHDCDPRPARRDAADQRLDHVDQLPGRADLFDRGGAAGGLDRGFVARQRTGVRTDRANRRLVTGHGQEDDWLAGGLRARCGADELAAVAEVLDIQGDRLREFVRGHRVDQLSGRQVGLVSERDEPREAEPSLLREQADLEREIAALGDHRDRSRWEIVGGELELGFGVEDPQAVGPDQHRPGVANLGAERVVTAAALGAGADHHDRAGAGRQRVVDGRLERRLGDRDQHEVHPWLQLEQ